MNKSATSSIILAAMFSVANAQTVQLPFTADIWDMKGAQTATETYLGKESILLKSEFIVTKDASMLDGVLEADISFPQQRGFPGIAFRMQGLADFEHFYVRPHQSGNPDATQYTPVFNNQAGWQLYHGEGYSKAFTYKFNTWHHIKIDVHGLQAEIYIDDMQTPLIKVKEMGLDWKTGKIALISGGLPVRFANVQFTPKQGSAPTRAPVPANGTDGLITEWQVSNTFNRKVFDKKLQLTPDIKNKLSWNKRQSEPSGTINLSRFAQWSDTTNTMIARLTIESSTEQVKVISFGFSDFVTVYLNDKAIYSGADNFMSRDYRFLGTIGFFDELYLPLKKGSNELWFVVSENFGGWGLKAKFASMENITLK